MSHIDPLFAVEAEQFLLAGMTDDALNLCREGIEEFPEYPMAYIILAQAYIQTGLNSDAKSLIEQAESRFPENKSIMIMINSVMEGIASETVAAEHKPQIETSPDEVLLESDEKYFEEIEETIDISSVSEEELVETEEKTTIVKGSTGIHDDSSEVFSSEFLSYQLNQAESRLFRASDKELIPGLIFKPTPEKFHSNYLYPLPNYPDFSKFNNLMNKQESIEAHEAVETDESYDELNQELEEIARRLEHARIQPVLSEEADEIFGEEDSTEPEIATETMAKIYEKQGAYELAAKTYKDLIASYSDKLRQFEEKIRVLEEKSQ